MPYTNLCCSGFPLDNVKNFSDKDLRLATDNYNPSKKLGRGGFGTVYQVFRLQTQV